MSFLHPAILLAIIPLLLAIAWSLRAERARSGSSWATALARCASCIALLAALAQPYIEQTRPADTLSAFLDISSSITPQQGQALLSRASSLARDLGVPLSIVPFAKEIAPIALPTTSSDSYAAIRQSWEKLDTGGTNLERVLSTPLASSLALILSDGYETHGSARQRLTELEGPMFFPLTALGESSEPEISLSQLSAPLTAKTQKSVDIRATITNLSGINQSGTATISHGDQVLLTRSVEVLSKQDLALTTQSNPALEGLNTISATFSWHDNSSSHSSTRTIWLSGEKRDRVLLLSGGPEDNKHLPTILNNQSYQLRTITAGQALEASFILDNFKAIILNNIAYAELPLQLKSGLARYVRSGGGLIMVGGNHSFGLGGYIGSPVEELLPVRLVPPHREEKRLNIAVQLVIDKSRSMATDDRLEFAKAAAAEVVRALKDEDYIGVIGFDDVPFIALPLSQLRNVRDSALSRISRLFPTSRTNLYPALDEARRGLARINAGRKHVIVLTDGKLPDPGPYYFELIKQMRILGMTLSTVLVGADVGDSFLSQMALTGGGAFYQTNDPSNLPRVFLSDIKVASAEKTLKEESDLPVRLGPQPGLSTKIRSFPTLRGFVETLQRESARTELVISDAEGTFPLLASWQVDQGRVVAFTSDANARWSAPWMRWEAIQDFWSDLVESVRQKKGGKQLDVPFDVRSWIEGDEMVLDLALFEEIRSQQITARLITPNGEPATINFSEVARGHYQARLPKAIAGTYRAIISVADATLPEVAWTLSGELFGERSHRQANSALLSEIATRSGGFVDPSSTDLRPLLKQTSQRESLVQLFLVLALACLLLEVSIRALRARR